MCKNFLQLQHHERSRALGAKRFLEVRGGDAEKEGALDGFEDLTFFDFFYDWGCFAFVKGFQ